MKLNKLQRHTAYIIMLKEAEYCVCTTGFCYLVDEVFGVWIYNEPIKTFNDDRIKIPFKSFLPELLAKRTVFRGDYFFNDWKERINILRKCIEETK